MILATRVLILEAGYQMRHETGQIAESLYFVSGAGDVFPFVWVIVRKLLR